MSERVSVCVCVCAYMVMSAVHVCVCVIWYQEYYCCEQAIPSVMKEVPLASLCLFRQAHQKSGGGGGRVINIQFLVGVLWGLDCMYKLQLQHCTLLSTLNNTLYID